MIEEKQPEESEATAVPVPGPTSGPTNHNCFQAGHHEVPLSHLDVREHFGQGISAQNYKKTVKMSVEENECFPSQMKILAIKRTKPLFC